jgi:hypothetical protein
LDLKDSITLGEGRGNAFSMFLKRGRKEIAVKAVSTRAVRELRRKLDRSELRVLTRVACYDTKLENQRKMIEYRSKSGQRLVPG